MSGWRTTTLGDVLELQRGHDLTEQERSEGSVPVIGSAGQNGWHDKARAKGPGVTVGRSGASIGVVTFIKSDYWPHNTVLYVKDFKGNDPAFVASLLRGINLAGLNSGSAQPSLNRNFVYPIEVRIPAPSLQRRIAGILSAYDDLIDVNQRRIAILEEMARRLFDEWFVRFRYPGHEAVPLVETELGSVPEGWPPIRADQLIAFDPRTKVAKEGEKIFVPMSALDTASSVISGWETRSGNAGAKFVNGDTLMARITPCLENGKTGLVNFLPEGEAGFGSTEFTVMRGVRVPPSFVYLLARSDAFRATAIKSMGGADGRQRVRTEALEGFEFARPPAGVLDGFAQLTEPFFANIRVLADQNTRLRTARDILLPKLISGEIDVGRAEETLAEAAE